MILKPKRKDIHLQKSLGSAIYHKNMYLGEEKYNISMIIHVQDKFSFYIKDITAYKTDIA